MIMFKSMVNMKCFVILLSLLFLIFHCTNTYSIEFQKIFEFSEEFKINHYEYLKSDNSLILAFNNVSTTQKKYTVKRLNISDKKLLWEHSGLDEVLVNLYLSNTHKYIVVVTTTSKNYATDFPNQIFITIYTIDGKLLSNLKFDSFMGVKFSPEDKYMLLYQELIQDDINYEKEDIGELKSKIVLIEFDKKIKHRSISYPHHISDVFFKDENSFYIANERYEVDLFNSNGEAIQNNLFKIKNRYSPLTRNYIHFLKADNNNILINNMDNKQLILVNPQNNIIIWDENIRYFSGKFNSGDRIFLLSPGISPIITDKSLNYKGHIDLNMPDESGLIGSAKNDLNLIFGPNDYWNNSDYYKIYDNFLILRKDRMKKIIGFKF